MGSRANYIVIEGTTAEISYAQWGALTVARELLAGPEAAMAFARGQRTDIGLMDNVFADGGVLLDSDRRTLLFWCDGKIGHFPYLRRVLLPVLRALWPDWSVDWATQGVVDMARYLGRDPARYVFADRYSGSFPYVGDVETLCATSDDLDGNVTILTVTHEDGRIADYSLVSEPERVMLAGPAILPVLTRKGSAPLPDERDDALQGGAYLDVAAHAIWVWEPHTIDPVYLDALTRSWPDWSIHSHVEGLVRQVILAGRSADSIMVPPDEAIVELADEFVDDDEEPELPEPIEAVSLDSVGDTMGQLAREDMPADSGQPNTSMLFAAPTSVERRDALVRTFRQALTAR